MRVYLGSDHAGYRLKQAVRTHLESRGLDVIDLGTNNEESCDYPDFIAPAAQKVAASKGADRGIVFGKSGNGEAMAANKIKGIRAALCFTVEAAKLAREHNDANVLSLGSGFVTEEDALHIVDAFLETPFSRAERHIRRLEKLHALEGAPYQETNQ